MIINNKIQPSYSRIHFGNKTKCLTSKPISFLDKYSKENTSLYAQKLLKDLKGFIASKKWSLEETDIKDVVGHGGLSTIFDIGNNEVLKCSFENPLEYRKHNPEFDIPFLSQVEKYGETYFVKEAKADTKNLTIEDCENVIRRIYKNCEQKDENKKNEYGKIHNKNQRRKNFI